jgi:hypothetical protein
MKKMLLLSILGFLACKKTIEIVEVPVEKKNSWAEIKNFSGTNRLFLSSGRSADAIYLQQPYFFTEYKPNNVTQYGAGLPTDITIRLPINNQFTAQAYSDTFLRIMSHLNPIASPTGGYFNLKQVDPSLTNIQTRFSTLFKSMAINKNDIVLLNYNNNRPSNPFTFMLMKVKTSLIFPYADSVFTKIITLPRTGTGAYVRHIAAVKDFFLVEIPAEGLFKIKEDGTFKKTSSMKTLDAFYEWQGKIYAHAEWNTVYISTDDGDTWQSYSGIPQFMTLSEFYTVKDSLVGVNNDNIYTLKWNNENYATRFLKNDGLENVKINGIEILKDSVYVATTSGLYVKSLGLFFEGK